MKTLLQQIMEFAAERQKFSISDAVNKLGKYVSASAAQREYGTRLKFDTKRRTCQTNGSDNGVAVGKRATIVKWLSYLMKTGRLTRVSRGVYRIK